MCIIAGEIEKVFATKIIVSALPNNKELVVYCNTVKLNTDKKPVAMILPYPNGPAGVKVIATKEEDNACFSRLNALFKVPTRGGVMYANSLGAQPKSLTKQLPVFRSGSYRYSVVKNYDELTRINNSVFNLNRDLKALLQEYSGKNFGFVVCIIDESANYSPFAYISDRLNGELFVPTKHYHEHSSSYSKYDYVYSDLNDINFNVNVAPAWESQMFVNSMGNIMNPSLDKNKNDVDWDHDIYIIGSKLGNIKSSIGSSPTKAHEGYRALEKKEYSFSEYIQNAQHKDLITKYEIKDDFSFGKNIDLVFPVY